MATDRKAFTIFGRVLDPQDGTGLAGLTVEALDKDLLVDDRLGSATTDKEGRFEIRYEKSDFQELFFDTKPDLYVQVKTSRGDVVYTSASRVRHEAADIEEFSIELPRAVLEHSLIEHTRRNFKQYIRINPNYFGTAPKVKGTGDAVQVFAQSGSTKYEELLCVGLYPEDDLLEAVFVVKLPYGFKTNLCGDGSKEYVAFYVDYDDGTGFVSAGPPTEVNVHDLVAVNDGHLHYAVRRAFIPKQLESCEDPQVVRLRAILSWEDIPTGPGFTPVWGNRVESWVQIRPKAQVLMAAVAPDIAVALDQIAPVPEEAILPVPLPNPEPVFSASGNLEAIKKVVDQSVASLDEEKASGQVETQRFDTLELMASNPNYFGSLSQSKEPEVFFKDIAKLPQPMLSYLTDNYTLNPDVLTPVFPDNPKVKYEELTCVGLYPEDDLLEATLVVKLDYGYRGDLCSFGSFEYVAFYIDWGTGWEHIDTARVRVHNIPGTSGKHLVYAVRSTIDDIGDKLRSCTNERIVRVRAILSWNHDPTGYGPGYTPGWGNVLERRVQIRPKDGVSVKPYIELINEVHRDEIEQTGSEKGYAWDPEDTTPPLDHNRPFGGVVAAWGKVNVPGAVYYRFRFSDDNGLTWSNVLNPRIARNPSFWFPVVKRHPLNSDGWFRISDYQADLVNYSLTPLVHWRSHGKNGEHLLRLELGDAASNPMPGQTSDIVLHLDNSGIDFYAFGGTPAGLPTVGVAVKDAAGAFKKCESFEGSDEIVVYGNFSDEHFDEFDVIVFGGNIPSGGHLVKEGDFHSPVAGVFDDQGIIGAAANGAGQEIARFHLCEAQYTQTPARVKCAYGVRLRVWDRAIVGYVSGYAFNATRHGRHGFVTFDWDPAGQC